ncbi:phage BR0599 family protein [Desulfovibrio inopinatus]|uniref:phage BR0599 family protein n=1 Tax=Desulfovibrio inopinatus TaxID=102109 RepID=UPI00042059E6|nr:phage BR0599 family protein [Desulfovibrio inopinatus]
MTNIQTGYMAQAFVLEPVFPFAGIPDAFYLTSTPREHATITVGGITCDPALIDVDGLTYSKSIDSTSMTVKIQQIKPIMRKLAGAAWAVIKVRLYWVNLSDPANPTYALLATMYGNPTLNGDDVEIECSPNQRILGCRVPRDRATKQCNHELFDSACQLGRGAYEVTLPGVSTPSDDQLMLRHVALAAYGDGYFQLGEVLCGFERRTIVNHTGDSVTLTAPFETDPTTIALTFLPGCDRNYQTCRDKFANTNHFGGLPNMPGNNPILLGA